MSPIPSVGFQSRPITVIGAGTLGRRIALMMSTQGGEVRLCDNNAAVLDAGSAYIQETLPAVLSTVPNAKPAKLTTLQKMEEAVPGSWLVFEAVPERLELKRAIFGTLDRISDSDTILASNSSSFPSSQFIDGVSKQERVLNTHFYMPPLIRAVEVMSDGKTDPGIVAFLMQQFPKYGLVPFHVQKESVGFIFNRIWAAIKRESLSVVAEGVSTPATVDQMFELFTGSKAGPFRSMDQVGLDVVLDIEEHYAAIRPGIPDGPRELLKSYVAKGWTGKKAGHGFYDDYKQ